MKLYLVWPASTQVSDFTILSLSLICKTVIYSINSLKIIECLLYAGTVLGMDDILIAVNMKCKISFFRGTYIQ